MSNPAMHPDEGRDSNTHTHTHILKVELHRMLASEDSGNWKVMYVLFFIKHVCIFFIFLFFFLLFLFIN